MPVNIIKPDVEQLRYDPDFPLYHIEVCGRTCYNSLDKMTEDSSTAFVEGLVKSKHFAMLEHATFVFMVSPKMFEMLQGRNLTVHTMEDEDTGCGVRHLNFTKCLANGKMRFLVSGNVRAINNTRCKEMLYLIKDIASPLAYEYPLEHDIKFNNKVELVGNIFDLPDLQEEEVRAHSYLTMRCVCDRGVTHEFVRMREMSFAQESTRYCNYAGGKYNGVLSFIEPSGFPVWDKESQKKYISHLEDCADAYNLLVGNYGRSPQEARAVLPNSLKAVLIATANTNEWLHFFRLRYFGFTGAPHPDMKVVAGLSYDKFVHYMERMNYHIPAEWVS